MAIAASARANRAAKESSDNVSAARRTESGGLCAAAGRATANENATNREVRRLTRWGRGAEALRERDRAARHPDSKVHCVPPFRPVARRSRAREAAAAGR